MASKQQVVTGSSTKSEIVPQVSIVPTSYWCLSKAEIDVDFKWTIERLAFFAESEAVDSFTSNEFESKYSLKLDFDKTYVTIYFLSSKLQYPLRVEITIFNGKSEIRKFKKWIPSNIQSPVFLYSTARTNLKSGRCVSGDVTISCKVESINKNQLMGKETTTVDETRVIIDQQDRILHQLEEMFNNMLLSDVTFNIRGRKFAAHKAILAMRGPVFAAMFHHPTKEMQSNQVEVKDIDPDVFQEVLRFIYTDKTQPTAMNKMAPNLLAAADKYLLEDLKSRCETHLIRQMSAENCLELLSLTTHHPAEHLKKKAIEYFRRYPGKPIELFIILDLIMNFLFVIVYFR
jgi:speckle-type POZ protein